MSMFKYPKVKIEKDPSFTYAPYFVWVKDSFWEDWEIPKGGCFRAEDAAIRFAKSYKPVCVEKSSIVWKNW